MKEERRTFGAATTKEDRLHQNLPSALKARANRKIINKAKRNSVLSRVLRHWINKDVVCDNSNYYYTYYLKT